MKGLLLLLGIAIGYVLPFLETVFALQSDELVIDSAPARRLWKEKRLIPLYKEVERLGKTIRLVHRRAVFFGALILLSLFVMTSTRSAEGFGVLIGLELHSVFVMIPLLNTPALLRKTFFWDLSTEVKDSTIRAMALGVIALLFMTGGAAILVL